MSPKQIKAQFEAEGVSISDWARARNYKIRTVYAVLGGRIKCHRGIGHQIAVDLGLKKRPTAVQFASNMDAA